MNKNQLTLLAFVVILFFNCTTNVQKDENLTEVSEVSAIERGQYLVTIMDCNTCHTPKKMTETGPQLDMDRMLSGFPASDELAEIPTAEITPGKWLLFNSDLTATAGPWGVSFAANLTPHESGLGNWTYEHFKTALTKGKHKGLENGRPILPPMPWQTYQFLAEDDIKAIFEYLKSIKPIENIVPPPIPFDAI